MVSQSTRRYKKERDVSTSPLKRAESQPRLADAAAAAAAVAAAAGDSDSAREEAARDKHEFLANFLRTRPSAAQVNDKVSGGSALRAVNSRSPPPDASALGSSSSSGNNSTSSTGAGSHVAATSTPAVADTTHLHISKVCIL
jgi:hypothetical protein